MTNRRKWSVFLALLIIYALSALLTYTFFIESLASSINATLPDLGVSPFVLGLANAGIVLVLYGLMGLAGIWFARRISLPGVYSEDGNPWRWVGIPFVLGTICGILLVIFDILFAPINGFGPIVHPGFPVSILASISAGIGEEIAFRGFVFGLWAFVLSWLFRRLNNRAVVLWSTNVIAALAFAAGHLGTAVALTGADSIAALNPVLVAEIFLLNTLVGLVAGERYMRDGLVAAVGVHFWTDIVFHVIWGLLGS